jgi:hypothetical protein
MTNPPTHSATTDSASHLRAALASIAISSNLGFNFVYTPLAPDDHRPASPLDLRILVGLQSLFRPVSDLPLHVPICNVPPRLRFSPTFFL